ncbi:MAG: hypothetical protein N2250_00825 [Pseudothermotoga sp.]|nr:hypothetical protein [Pseudothermotoga sp.]
MKLLPVLFLTGDAEVLKQEYVKELCMKVKAKRMRIEIEEKEMAFNLLTQSSFFLDNVLLDIVDFDDWKKDEQRKLLQLAESSNITAVVRTQEAIKAKNVATFFVPKPWEQEKWLTYIAERLRKHGISASRSIVEMIFERVGPNDELLEKEIEKLACVSNRPDEKLVRELIVSHAKADLEEFCFVVSTKRFKEAHAILKSILSHTEAVVVVSTIIRHFLDLYKLVLFADRRSSYSWPVVKQLAESLGLGLGKTAKFLGFSFKGEEKTLNHVVAYDVEKLEKILERLYWLDLTVKSSPTPNLLLHNFLFDLKQILGDEGK